MAVIDELIVKLGLDAKDFKRGSASATRDLDKTKKEANKVANDIRHSGKDAAKFFGEMAISAAQFFSVLGGATSLTAFARQMTNAQASLGLFSQNINNNSRDLVAWQNAVGAFGGTADGLNGTLQKLSTAQQNYKLGIADPDMIARLNKLKVGFSEPTKMLMDLSKAIESAGMDRATAANFLSPLIGDQATLNAVLQGSKALESQIGKMKRLNIVEKDSIERAQKLREQWNELSKRGENLGNQLYAKLQPFIEKTLTWFEKLSDWCSNNKDVVAGTITAIGVAIGASLVPALAKLVASPIVATGIAIAGLAASIGLLYDDYKTWKKGGDSFIHWEKWRGEFDAAGNLIDNLSLKIKEHGGIWKWLGEQVNPIKDIFNNIMDAIERAFNRMSTIINIVTKGKTSGIGWLIGNKAGKLKDRIVEDFNIGKDAAKAFLGDTEAKKRTGIQAYGGLGEDRGNGTYGSSGIMPSNYAKLAKMVSSGEGGYNSVNYYKAPKGNHDLSKMTIADVMAEHAKYEASGGKAGFFAAGRNQIIPSTLRAVMEREAKKKDGLRKTDMFGAKEQDKIFMNLVQNRPALDKYINGKSNDRAAAMLQAAMEWDSLPKDASGMRYRKGGGKANTSYNYFSSTLDSIRNGDMSGTAKVASMETTQGKGKMYGHLASNDALNKNLQYTDSDNGAAVRKGAVVKGVDQDLVAAVNEYAKTSPYKVVIKHGVREGDHREHGHGGAIDVTLIDPKTNKVLDDYQNPDNFAAYQAMAHGVYGAMMKSKPQKAKNLRSGLYFSGTNEKYGAFDLMHLDLAGNRIGMAGGSWEHGVNAKQAKTWGVQNNPLLFAANNPNYRQSSRQQPVQSTSSVRSNEVNIQNVNVTTSKETAPGIWKDMKAAIKDNPLMQYNEAMSWVY